MSSLLLLTACVGEVSGLPGTTPSPTPFAPREPRVVDRPEVVLPLAQLKLLPFEVRLSRAAAAVGVPVSDGLFDAARARRLELGAHDFANGTSPDLAWNAQRMAAWVEVMLPVCQDARVRSHLGAWETGGVAKLVEAGFGRSAAAADLDDLAGTLALPGDEGWVATCLALVSSTELLVQ